VAKPDDIKDNTVTFGGQSASQISYGPGDIVGNSYELISVLARGGMGVLFKAQHLELQRVFALKLLAPGQITDTNWKRFEIEGRALAKLEHANVVQIFNMGVDARGCPFYVMELLDGQSMADYVDDNGPLTVSQFADSFIDVCAALKLAHNKNIVHRDIKPANLILIESPSGKFKTKVVDFGIARLVGLEGNIEQGLTKPGEICGSPAYMSPEQTAGEAVTHLTDIYSVGCTMFTALTGSVPFKGKTAVETMLMHQSAALPEIYREDCSAAQERLLNEVVAGCMEKEPEDRFQNLDDIAELLNELIAGSMEPQAILPKAEKTKDEYYSEPDSAISKDLLVAGATVFGLLLIVGIIGLGYLYAVKPGAPPKKAETKASTADLSVTNPWDQPTHSTSPYFRSTKQVSEMVKVPPYHWVFHFPKDQDIGIVSEHDKVRMPATGDFTTGDLSPILFFANKNVAYNPEYYLRFAPDAVSDLSVESSSTPPAVQILSAWTNLTHLTFVKCTLSPEYCSTLGDLPHLKVLSFVKTSFSATALMRSGLSQRLKSIKLDQQENTEEVLQVLQSNPHLRSVGLRNMVLTEQEILHLTKMSTLIYLDLKYCQIDAKSFKALTQIKHLISIGLEQATYPTELLKELKRCSNLQELVVTRDSLSQQQLQEIKTLMPKLKIIQKK